MRVFTIIELKILKIRLWLYRKESERIGEKSKRVFLGLDRIDKILKTRLEEMK
jgi:hypothetical protein